MAGLYIERKTRAAIIGWMTSVVVVALMLTVGWFAYQWFVTGEKPPIIPLPASALADSSVDESPVTDQMVDSYTVPATHPRYISIPALNIEKARVQLVGLTKNNTLDTPRNLSDTAWYDNFVNLDKLTTGDEIMIERGDGKQIVYKVTENKTESLKDTNATGMQRLMTPYDGTKEGLGLITCAGNWVPRDKVFDKRILVRAVIADSE